MRVRDQGRPLFARESLGDVSAVDGMAMSTAAKKERARIPRVMEDPQRAPMLQGAPERLGVAEGVPRPAWKWELLIAEGFYGRGGGSSAPKRLEEGAEGLLDLLIRIQADAPCRVRDEAHGQRDLELAAASLIHDAPAQPRPQHV